jgi:hypothetical protein
VRGRDRGTARARSCSGDALGDFQYCGYLASDALARLLAAAVRGEIYIARRTRIGLTVQENLEAGEQRCLTDHYQLPGAFLALVPFIEDRIERSPPLVTGARD